DFDDDLPEFEFSMAPVAAPAEPAIRRVRSRAQFQGNTMPVKDELPDGDVKGENDSKEEVDARADEPDVPEGQTDDDACDEDGLQMRGIEKLTLSLYTKICDMMKHTAVKPPMPPGDAIESSMALAVEDGITMLEFNKVKGVTALSLAAAWPSGSHLAPVAKIRNTVNSYVSELANPKWFEEFILGALHALQRRLTKHQHNIIGKTQFEVQQAFNQLCNRLSALIALHKTMRAWVDAQVDRLLQETLEPFSVVIAYMMHAREHMSEELNIVVVYATFQGMAISTGSVARAIEAFDVEILTIINTITEKDPPAEAEPMVSDAMQTWLCGLADTSVTDNVLAIDFMFEIGFIATHWKAKEVTMRTELEDDTFSEVLGAVETIAKCASGVESDRPPTAEVRQARKLILDQVRQPTSPASELARTLQAYPVGKAMMEASRTHVAQSIEDDMATHKFEVAASHFEKDFEACFDDLQAWADTVRKDSPNKCFDDVNVLFNRMNFFFTSAHGAISKWSTSAAHANLEFMADNLNNSMSLLRVGRYMMMDIYAEVIGPFVPKLGAALLGLMQACEAQDPIEDGTSTDGKTDDKECHDRLVKEYSTTAGVLAPSLATFASSLSTLTEKWTKCKNGLAMRCGDAAFDKLEKEYVTNPDAFENEIKRVSCLLQDMVTCMNYCVNLVEQRRSDFSTAAQADAFTDLVVKFASSVRWMRDEDFMDLSVSTQSSVTNVQTVKQTSDSFKQFLDGPASRIYNDCADSFIGSKLAEISPSLSFKLGEVSVDVMREVPPHEALSRLIASVSVKSILLDGVNWVDGSTIDDTAMDDIPYNRALSDLLSFAEAASLDSILIPDTSHNGEHGRMKMEHAKIYLDMVAQVKDIAGCAAQLHVNVFERSVLPNDQLLFGEFVHAQRMMSRVVLRLDALLLSAGTHEFEKEGWVCCISPQSVRQWLQAIAIFSNSAKSKLLEMMALSLQKHADACRSGLPDLTAATDKNGQFVEKLAQKIFKDQTAVVASYNVVHKALTYLSRAGSMLEIVPVVSEHDATQTAVATAMACL
ncbi:unnamed protein product, partial [Prorocentrum cordatum]